MPGGRLEDVWKASVNEPTCRCRVLERTTEKAGLPPVNQVCEGLDQERSRLGRDPPTGEYTLRTASKQGPTCRARDGVWFYWVGWTIISSQSAYVGASSTTVFEIRGNRWWFF